MAKDGHTAAVEAAGKSLGLADISAMVQVIDVVSKRGAINGDELVPVGTLRQKLVDFLTAAQKEGQDVSIPGAPSAEAQEEAAETDAA
jgi:hypothetical protein